MFKNLFVMSALVSSLCASLALASGGGPRRPTDPRQLGYDVDRNMTIGVSLRAHRFSQVYFAGQPSMEDFKALKEQGFVHVINLRTAEEYDETAERQMMQELDMAYDHVPFSMNQGITQDLLSKMEKAVDAHQDKGKVLIHCGSGMRVAFWLGAHLHTVRKQSKPVSMLLAGFLGLENPQAQEMLYNYLMQQR